MESVCGEEMVFLELSKEGKRELRIYELILLFSSGVMGIDHFADICLHKGN